jgi:cytochrome c-type biogenesis protein CcmF
VENVSFMPWLAGTALLHSTLVAQSRGSFMRWTLLLAITTFSLSLVGTFIVRSGVLTSVHAFAVDPERGVFILALLLLATGGALTLYALRSHKIEHGASFQGVSREAGLVINNIAIIIATVIVFLGTFYPLFIDALTGDKITVGPPYYNLMFVILTLPLMVFMGVGPMLKWRTDTLSRLKPVMAKMAIFALVIAVLTAIWGRNVYGVLGMAAAAWLAAGTAAVYAKRLRVGEAKSDAGNLWRRFRLLPGAAHGFAMAHMGMAVMLAGITGMSVWMAEDIDRLKLGESINLAGYEYRLESMAGKQGDNYIADAGVVTVWKNGQQLSTLRPERRYYPVEENFTTEGAMGVGFSRIVYAAIGEGGQEQGWIVRVYYHPMVVFIWLGALIMSIGGFVSLADRRYGFVRGPKRVRASATKPKLSEAAV